MSTNHCSFLPRDFVETDSGLILAVVLYGLEEGRVLSWLRYVRESHGLRKVDSAKTHGIVRERAPELLYRSPQRDVPLHGVPVSRVAKHFQPRSRLAELLQAESTDPFAEKVVRVARLFGADCRGGPEVGVTGSVLVGAHGDRSDVDLVFYDRSNFFQAREQVRSLINGGQLQAMSDPAWRETYERRGCSLTYEEYLWHERRKWNKFLIKGTKVDISLVGAQPSWDTPRCRKVGRQTIHAQVVEASAAFDYPARYIVEHSEISEVVSYNPTYTGQAETGEFVEAAGWVELLEDGRRRLLVGTSREAAGEYLRVMPRSSGILPEHKRM